MRSFWELYSSDQAVRNGEDFIGRRQGIGEILDCIHSANCIQVVGPRRIGKSSLLLHMTRASTLNQRPEILLSSLLVYFNLQSLGNPTEDSFWGQAITAIKNRLCDMAQAQNQADGDTPPLQHHQREIQGWIDNVPHHANEGLSYQQAIERLDDLKELGFKRMTLLLDELEVLGQIPTQRDLTQRLRALAGDPRFPVTFVTASRLPIAQLTEDGTLSASPFFNIFSQTVRLGPFDANELKALIRLPEDLDAQGALENWQSGLSLSPHLPWIQFLGGHHPFYCTVTCRRLLRMMGEPLREGQPLKTLSPGDLKILERDLEDDLSGQIVAAIQDRSTEEQALMLRIAQGLSHLPKKGDPAIQGLIDAGLVDFKIEAPQIASQLVLAHLKADHPEVGFFTRHKRRILGGAFLSTALLMAAILGHQLYGPLPRGTETLKLGERAHINVSYPEEVRVGETATVEVTLDALGGEEGAIQVSILSEGGGFTFPDQEVQHTFKLSSGLPLHQVWSAKIMPHAMERAEHLLVVRSHWIPVFGGHTVADPMQLSILSRALAGAKVIISSAATVILALLGFFGLSARGVGDWLLSIFKQSKT